MGKGGAMREYAEEPRGSTSRNGEKCWGLRVGGKGGHAEAGCAWRACRDVCKATFCCCRDQ